MYFDDFFLPLEIFYRLSVAEMHVAYGYICIFVCFNADPVDVVRYCSFNSSVIFGAIVLAMRDVLNSHA